MRHVQRQLTTARPGGVAWLGVIAVVLLQLQLATHLNLDHDTILEMDDSCEVCLKLDASGKVPMLAQPAIPVPRGQATPTVADSVAVCIVRDRPQAARAPPLA